MRRRFTIEEHSSSRLVVCEINDGIEREIVSVYARGARGTLLRESGITHQVCGKIEGRGKTAILRAVEGFLGHALPCVQAWDPDAKAWKETVDG